VRAGQHDGRAAHHAGRTTSTCCAAAALSGGTSRWSSSPPKSLLRLKAATSATAEFTHGAFQPLIGEPDGFDAGKVRRVVLCTARSTTTSTERQAKLGATDTAIVRVERLYRSPRRELRAELSRYAEDVELVWAQEEPEKPGCLAADGAPAARAHRPTAQAGRAAGELGTRVRLRQGARGDAP